MSEITSSMERCKTAREAFTAEVAKTLTGVEAEDDALIDSFDRAEGEWLTAQAELSALVSRTLGVDARELAELLN